MKTSESSCYKGACIILTTKHGKSAAIAPSFERILGAGILEYVLDTDRLGTFSGEVGRKGNALECAKRKCAWGMKMLGEKIEYGLANEGSFGPHPLIPFLACDNELLIFIDKHRNFILHEIIISETTNFGGGAFTALDEAEDFLKRSLFPSHALIVRPNEWKSKKIIFKGIENRADLEDAFAQSKTSSKDQKVWIETDMRAHMNPSRMQVISQLADQLAQRLATSCPSCATPGWGQVGRKAGLLCEGCGFSTEMTLHEIYGCVKCDYKESRPRKDRLQKASASQCQWCNP